MLALQHSTAGAPRRMPWCSLRWRRLTGSRINKLWCDTCGYTEEVEGKSCTLLQGEETDVELIRDLMMAVRRRVVIGDRVQLQAGGAKFLNQVIVTVRRNIRTAPPA